MYLQKEGVFLLALLIGIQLFIIILFFLLGWAIRYKKIYWLLSGFDGRPEEEKRQLIENGLPQKTGGMMIAVAAGMLILLPLSWTSFQHSMEVQFGFMIFFLMGGLIYLSRYEVPHKRKRSYMINSALALVVIGFITCLLFLGYQGYELVIKEETFEITGMYGREWKIDDITTFELMEKMPQVTWKQNGFGMTNMAKGYFTVKDYGSSLLFIRKNSPYIYIKVKEKNIFINGETPDQTLVWYDQLKKNTGG